MYTPRTRGKLTKINVKPLIQSQIITYSCGCNTLFFTVTLDIIHHHCGVSGLYYARLSFRWYGDLGPIAHVVLSLSVAQGGLTLCISLVSISVRGLVPLHNACSYGHYEVAELLVKVIHLRECFSCSWCIKDLPVVWNVIHLFTPPPPTGGQASH